MKRVRPKIPGFIQIKYLVSKNAIPHADADPHVIWRNSCKLLVHAIRQQIERIYKNLEQRVVRKPRGGRYNSPDCSIQFHFISLDMQNAAVSVYRRGRRNLKKSFSL